MYNSESFEIFSRLIAKEHITVRFADIGTACFFHESREIVLPYWNYLSPDSFTGLCIHEVGHAIFTPIESRKRYLAEGVSNNAYEVLEDVYIERRIKATYPGARGILQGMYKEFADEGLFTSDGNTKIEDRTFLDRANIFYKIGAFLDVPFSAEEQNAIELGKYIVRSNYVKIAKIFDDLQKQPKPKTTPEHSLGSEDDFGDLRTSTPEPTTDPEYSEPDSEQEPEPETNGDSEHEIEPDSGSEDSEAETEPGTDTSSESSESLESDDDELESMQDLANHLQPEESILANEQVFGSKTSIGSPDEIHKVMTQSFQYKNNEYAQRVQAMISPKKKLMSKKIKELEKTALHLVQLFEQLRSAKNLQNSRIDETGVLDVELLHRVLFDTDVFAEEEIQMNGENHGMVILVDMSGSMLSKPASNIDAYTYSLIESVMRKAIIFGFFCRKIDIPFSVVSFTDSRFTCHQRIGNLYYECVLVELINNNLTSTEFIYAINGMLMEGTSNGMLEFGCTPLNVALILMREFIRDFNHQYNVEKLSFLVLNDGASEKLAGNKRDETLYDPVTGLVGADDKFGLNQTNFFFKLLRLSFDNIFICNVFVVRFAPAGLLELGRRVGRVIDIATLGERASPESNSSFFSVEGVDCDLVIGLYENSKASTHRYDAMFTNVFIRQFA